jgi:hypothetical protein
MIRRRVAHSYPNHCRPHASRHGTGRYVCPALVHQQYDLDEKQLVMCVAATR